MKHRLNTHCAICDAVVGNKAKVTKRGEVHCVNCRRNTAPDDYRCKGMTTKNERCKHWTREESDYCARHQNYEVTE